MNLDKIGMFIKKKRMEKGLTQEQLADKLNVSPKTVSRWERGLNIPDVSILKKLSEELGVSTNSLIEGDEHHDNMIVKTEEVKLEKRMAFPKIVLYSLIISLIVLIDVSYGCFSAFLSWQINEKMISPKGVIFSLLFDSKFVNYTGVILTKMFYIFIVVLVLNVSLVLVYVIFSLYKLKTQVK